MPIYSSYWYSNPRALHKIYEVEEKENRFILLKSKHNDDCFSKIDNATYVNGSTPDANLCYLECWIDKEDAIPVDNKEYDFENKDLISLLKKEDSYEY